MTDYLFHYTSVESLALILKNRTFRFSPLSALDDLLEEKVKDSQKFGNYVFISSWTDDNKESIPMWNMYSNMTSGVRIKMKANPFKKYDIDTKLLQQKYSKMQICGNSSTGYKMLFPAITPEGYKSEFTINKLIIPTRDFFLSGYYLYNCTPDNLLIKVTYTDMENLLIPQIVNNSSINIGNLGNYKKTYWEFQNEWRYILRFSPIGFKAISERPILSMNNAFNIYNTPFDALPFNYYFLELEETSLETMEVTLSPKISDGYKTIVYLLKKEYNPNMIIKESDLTNNIR